MVHHSTSQYNDHQGGIHDEAVWRPLYAKRPLAPIHAHTHSAALVFVYEYYPNARNLLAVHVTPTRPATTLSSSLPPNLSPRFNKGTQNYGGRGENAPSFIPEPLLWSYAIQIANAVKAVHDKGMAVRVMDVTKLLLVSQNRYGQGGSVTLVVALIVCRIRLDACGVFDVVAYNPSLSVELMQVSLPISSRSLNITLPKAGRPRGIRKSPVHSGLWQSECA